MTETQEIKTPSINLLVTGQEGDNQVLLIGLKAGYQDKPQYQRALHREFAEQHEIDHPNIIRYTDLREVAPYGECIVMEWEPARTLADYMAEGHSREELADVVRQTAAALNFLHAQGKVHGALSPACIFVTREGDRVKLLNFRLRYADRMHEPADSLRYRAPEAKDGTVTLDARTDIFSLGQIVRMMNLGEESQQVVAGACSFGRNDRFASVNEMMEAFDHRRPARRPSASSGSSASAGGGKRAALIISAIVSIAVVGALLFFNHQSDPDQDAATSAEVVDTSVQQGESAAPAPSDAAASSPEATAQQGSAPVSSAPAASAPADAQYTGELAFLATLVPQMHIDIDKIYARGDDAATTRRRVTAYYKGLRRTLKGLSATQYEAFDKAFAEYNTKKKSGE